MHEGQPERIAWRIVVHWLEVQLAMVEVGNATVEQIMLPYVVLADQRTLYDAWQDGAVQRALGAGKQEPEAERGR